MISLFEIQIDIEARRIGVMVGMNEKRWVALRLPILRWLRVLFMFSSVPLASAFCGQSPSNQLSLAPSVQTISNQRNVVKVLLGPNKTPFCLPSAYVTGTGQLSDGSWRLDATMFLPDLSSESVYDKLHPITPSPTFQSPERVAYEHSILQIEVTSSYQGENDPTGEISQNQGMKNSVQIDHLSTNDPIDGFKEYDDQRGNPDIYFDAGGKPRFITCFGNACGISEILNHSISIDIRLDKVAVTRSLFILARLNSMLESLKCQT